MDIESLAERLKWIPRPILAMLEKRLKHVPAVRERIDREAAGVMEGLRESLKPYRDDFSTFAALPATGLSRDQVVALMEALRAREQDRWQDGYVSGAVYHGDEAHIDFLNRVYALNSQSNPLHADLWPSTTKFEAEIVAMTARMLGAEPEGSDSDGEICGTVSSGGTESILLAMKAYRDLARDRKGVRRAEIVAPVTAHAAFEKAARYFDMKLVEVPVDDGYRADVEAVGRAVSRDTAVIVGSAPSFPHGIVDPIEELSELARERGIGFHTDACLGGFVLPWARKLGYPVPAFDFSLPGVTSISADTHKYGYAAKGTSVILYRGRELRHYQYYTTGDWTGGLYVSPTFAGSRPGALSATCWAALVSMGESGYTEATRRILEAADRIKEGIHSIPELRLLGDPLFNIAFASDALDIYQVMEVMAGKQWNLNGLFNPPAVHLCVTLRHTQPGVVERFLADLHSAVETVEQSPDLAGNLAPVYGMAASLPLRGLVDDLLKGYLDLLYEVGSE
ncbi:MAG TPA: aminotransferase class V-fold PLP-dependent enzyme [Anaerolineae bacterium]|nr:aminotransferase class V-fold PLP-dependent enzyme [Anaerolineae bacterium]